MENLSFEARLLHTPFEKEDAYHALAMPVYNTAAYEFDSAEAMEAAFCGRTSDYAYSRITNPTVQYFEDRVKAVTGAASVTALNSGMAAISNALMTLAYANGNIVTSAHLFGNTYSFMKSTLGAFGVEVRFCDLTDPDAVLNAIDANTCCVFLEVITNPQLEVVNLKKLAAVAAEYNVPVVADTTIVPFSAFKAADFGIDIEIISSTKYISGGATSVGGLILDHGRFNWASNIALKHWHEQFGPLAFTARLRKEIHRNLGAYMTPQVAYTQTPGLETMQFRYHQQAATCLGLAVKLETPAGRGAVTVPGFHYNPYFGLARSQYPN